MNLEIWTDGRFLDGHYVSNAIALTNDTFIKRIIKVGSAKIPYESEVYAVREILRYLTTIDTSPFDNITIYTDAHFMVPIFTSLMYNKKSRKDVALRDVILAAVQDAEQLEAPVVMLRYPAHLYKHNPNKTCDITCRIVSKEITRLEAI